MIFFPDAIGHIHGPYSKEIKEKLIELDNLLGYLIEKLKLNNLLDKLNLIITSDHGMESTSVNGSIYLDKYVNIELFEIYGSDAVKHLFLKNGKL
jgi:ectonucleotide pyrophosphatase/phosphodiesterase family protein 5